MSNDDFSNVVDPFADVVDPFADVVDPFAGVVDPFAAPSSQASDEPLGLSLPDDFDKPATMRTLLDQGAADVGGMDDVGTFENALRGAGERVGSLAGGVMRSGDAAAKALEERIPLGGFVFEEGNMLPSYYGPERYKAYMETTGSKELLDNLSTKASNASLGYVPEHTWENVKSAFSRDGVFSGSSWGEVMGYAFEQGVTSVPDMVAAVVNLPAYISARSGEMGEERARNKGKESTDIVDVLEAAPFAVGSALLERIGAKGISDAGKEAFGKEALKAGYLNAAKHIGREGLKAGKKEAITEYLQEGIIEYTGTRLGTDAEMTLAESFDAGLAGAVAGGVYGGAAGGAKATVEAAGSHTGKRSQEERGETELDELSDLAEEFKHANDPLIGIEGEVRKPEPQPESVFNVDSEGVVDTSGAVSKAAGERQQQAKEAEEQHRREAPLYSWQQVTNNAGEQQTVLVNRDTGEMHGDTSELHLDREAQSEKYNATIQRMINETAEKRAARFEGRNPDPNQVFVPPTEKAPPLDVAPTTDEVALAAAETNAAPTPKQIEADNYKKGRTKIGGFNIAIENAKGAIRKGVDAGGREWESKMAHHYGDIKGVKGADGDDMDVFIGDNPASSRVFIVDQIDPETHAFDEHKVMMGFDSLEAAQQGYLANYENGWGGLGQIRESTMDEFKKWTKEGDTSQPFTLQSPQPQPATPEIASAPRHPEKSLPAESDQQTGTLADAGSNDIPTDGGEYDGRDGVSTDAGAFGDEAGTLANRSPQDDTPLTPGTSNTQQEPLGAEKPAITIEPLTEKSVIIKGVPKSMRNIMNQSGLKAIWRRKENGWMLPAKRLPKVQAELDKHFTVGSQDSAPPAPEPAPVHGSSTPSDTSSKSLQESENKSSITSDIDKRPDTETTPTKADVASKKPSDVKATKANDAEIGEKPSSSIEQADVGDSSADVTPISGLASDISFDEAYDAYRGISHTPDQRARQTIESYVNELTGIYGDLEKLVRNDTERELLDREFERFREKYRDKQKAVLSARSKTLSSMITGPAKFNVNRNNKSLSAEDKRVQEMISYKEKTLKRIKKDLRPETKPIISGAKESVKRLEKKLDERVRYQERMKLANRIIRSGKNVEERLTSEVGLSEAQANSLQEPDFAGRKGFADYELKNNNAEIRRLRKRLEEEKSLQEKAAASDPELIEFEGGSVEINYDDNRIRIQHDRKPSEDTLQAIKKAGWKWSRKNSAWQRQLTKAARYSAEELTGVNVSETESQTTRSTPKTVDDQINFRESFSDKKGMKTEAVQRIVDRQSKGWTNAPEIQVVASIKDLPVAIQEQIQLRSANRVSGVHDGRSGRVYLVAENIATGHEARTVLAHEVVGHYAMENMLGDSFVDLVDQVQRLKKRDKKIQAIADGVNSRGNAHIESAEVIAKLAETELKHPIIIKAFAALRKLLRRLGFNVSSFGTPELKAMLVDAMAWLRRGEQSQDTGDIFSPVAFSSESYSEFVDQSLLKTESVRASATHNIGSTPNVLKALGAEDLPFVISDAVVRKAVEKKYLKHRALQNDGKHFLTPDQIKKIPEAVSNPAMVFDSSSDAGGLVVVTDMVDRLGDPIVVAIHLNKRDRRMEVNRIASAYGKNNSGVVRKWIQNGKLAYRHTKKGRSWLQSQRLQLPWEGVKNDLRGKVLTEKDIVKRSDEQVKLSEQKSGKEATISAHRKRPGQIKKIIKTGEPLNMPPDLKGENSDLPSQEQQTLATSSDSSVSENGLDSNESIKFSQSADGRLVGNVANYGQQVVDIIVDTAKHRFSDMRPHWLALLTRRHIADIAGKTLPQIKQYVSIAQFMDARRTELLTEGAKIAERWAKFNMSSRKEAQELADLMHDSTIAGVDPSVKYRPLITEAEFEEIKAHATRMIRERSRDGAGGGKSGIKSDTQWRQAIKDAETKMGQEANRKRARRSLEKRWKKLSPAAQSIYRDVRDTYKERQQMTLDALEARINRTISDKSHARALIDMLRKEFESIKVEEPYFPLARFGDYWVHAKKGDEKVFQMFESSKEQSRFMDEMEKQGYKVRHGVKLDNLKELDGVSAKFVTDVESLIEDKLGNSPHADQLRDEIYQMYLKTLPDLSLRKHSLHRKKTAGFAKDALRAYAHNLFHGSYQLARLEYVDQLQAELSDMEAGLSADPERLADDIAIHKQAIGLERLSKESVHQMRGDLARAEREDGLSPDEEIRFEATKLALLRWDEKHRLHNDYAKLLRVRDAANQIGGDRVKAGHLFKEMLKRHEWAMNPKGAAWVNSVSSIGFTWYLGVSPAAAAVNLTQTPTVALPIMAARMGGWGKATRALTKTTQEFFAGGFGIESQLKGQRLAAYEEAVRSGVIDKTLAHDLAGISEEGATFDPKRHMAMKGVSFLFHHAERMNREVTYMAAYDLARSNGLVHEKAVQAAHDLTWDAHFDYSSGNKARVMQGDVPKVIFMFRQFSLNMSYLLVRSAVQWASQQETPAMRREARNQLLGILGMHFAFAGVIGLPLFGVLAGVINAVMDDEDEPYDFETEMRNFLHDSGLPKPAAEAMSKGVFNAALGVDVHSRTSLNGLWLRSSNRELEGRDTVAYWFEQLLGPVGGIALGMGTAYDLYQDGHGFRSLESAVPKFAKDVFKGYRYWDEGVNNLKDVPLVEDLPPALAVMQAMGLSPAVVNDRYDANNAVKQKEQALLGRRQNLMNKFFLAWKHSDNEGRDEALKLIQRFNRKNPRIRIRTKDLRSSIKARMRATSRMGNGVMVSKKLDYLREEGRFAE